MILVGMLLLVAAGQFLLGQVDEYNVPDLVRICVEAVKERDFELSSRMNPFYLRGDFDGDHKADYAVLIVQKKTRKGGILVCFGGGRHEPARLGAGTPVALEGGQESDDLTVFDAWNVEEPDRDYRKDRIHLIAKEAGSGLFYWDGRRFRWRQLGI